MTNQYYYVFKTQKLIMRAFIGQFSFDLKTDMFEILDNIKR